MIRHYPHVNVEAILETRLKEKHAMEGLFPVNDLKAEQQLKILTETVRHALTLLHGPALCLHGTVEAAYMSLAKAIKHEEHLKHEHMPNGEWRDYVGE